MQDSIQLSGVQSASIRIVNWYRDFYYPLSTRNSLSRVEASTTCSGSTTFLSLTLVTKKHKYLPNPCKTEVGNAARPPNPGLCLNRNSTFLNFFSKSAPSLVLKLISANMQIALVLSDKLKSLSVIKMFSEYSFGIPNLVLKFFPMVGSTFSCSSSNQQISLDSLSFVIFKLLVRVSSTPTPRTKKNIDVPVDGAELKLSDGISNGRSIAV